MDAGQEWDAYDGRIDAMAVADLRAAMKREARLRAEYQAKAEHYDVIAQELHFAQNVTIPALIEESPRP